MSESLINQITLDCLLNKKMYNSQIKNNKTKQINHEERKFYRKRIYNLFKDMISENSPNNLLLDVKYAYENYINATINYFKIIDSNDIIQGDHDYEANEHLEANEDILTIEKDISHNSVEAADSILMRSIKITTEIPTLDKYIKRSKTKPLNDQPRLIIPKQKEINLNDPQLKNKGIKNNINNIYEDKNKKKEDEEK
jgi:hypothetical protein